jgi:hypothetical protein
MRVALSLLQQVLLVLCVVLFPALALRAKRTGGSVSLWRLTGISVGLILLLAAVAASAPATNAVGPTYGYGYTAPRVLLLFGLTLGLPLISAGFAVHMFSVCLRSQLGVYAIGVICAEWACVVGVLAAIRILYFT